MIDPEFLKTLGTLNKKKGFDRRGKNSSGWPAPSVIEVDE